MIYLNCMLCLYFWARQSKFIDKEIDSQIKKRVIAKSQYEKGEFVSPIIVRSKSDGGFKLILNLKKLNDCVDY